MSPTSRSAYHAEPPVEAELRAATRAAWQHFLGLVDPLRPNLFRYCRRLTGNVWDAEDLIQDTLEQAFARLGSIEHELRSPHAYLLRIASNRWVDRIRREQREARLLAELAPQERAAALLKEVFGLSLNEIADTLGTTIGAVKAALHRGRVRLHQPRETPSARGGAPESPLPPGEPIRENVSRAVLERFVECFNARDRAGLLALLLDGAAIRMPGVDYEIGRDGFDREPGWLHYNLRDPRSRWDVPSGRASRWCWCSMGRPAPSAR